MTKAALYFTRFAAKTLRDIHAHSVEQWGEDVAQRYMNDIYAIMKKITYDPKLGELRKYRSAPFCMIPARSHYIVYERMKSGIIILALLHQRRNIEQVVASMRQQFFADIEQIKKNIK